MSDTHAPERRARSLKTAALWLLTCLIWSSLWLFIKLGLRDLPPLSFGALRLTAALLLILPATLPTRRALPETLRHWKLIAFTGSLIFGANYGLVFWGTQYITSGMAAVLQSSTPLFGLLLSSYYLDKPVTLGSVCSISLGVGGVALVFSNQMTFQNDSAALGCAAVAGGAACVATAYVLIKARGGGLNQTHLAAGQMLFSAIPMLAIALLHDGSPSRLHWTPASLFSLLYLALAGSVIAFRLNYLLLRRMDVTKVLAIAIAEPFLATVIGAAALGEKVTGQTLLGGVLIAAGTCAILFRERAASTRPIPEPAHAPPPAPRPDPRPAPDYYAEQLNSPENRIEFAGSHRCSRARTY